MNKVVIDSGKIDCNFSNQFPNFTEALFSGKITVYTGGTKFKSELTKAGIRYLLALEKAGRTTKISDEMVDSETRKIEVIFRKHPQCFKTKPTSTKPCDDPHLYALLELSNTKNLVTHDQRVFKCYKCVTKNGANYSRFNKPRLLLNEDDCKKARLF